MKKVISVRFKENGKSYYFDPGDAVIHAGEYVIVETARGVECGEVVQGVLELGRRLKAAGAQSIALACTGMSTVGLAPQLQEVLKLPVIDPVLAEGLFAYYECIQKQ